MNYTQWNIIHELNKVGVNYYCVENKVVTDTGSTWEVASNVFTSDRGLIAMDTLELLTVMKSELKAHAKVVGELVASLLYNGYQIDSVDGGNIECTHKQLRRSIKAKVTLNQIKLSDFAQNEHMVIEPYDFQLDLKIMKFTWS